MTSPPETGSSGWTSSEDYRYKESPKVKDAKSAQSLEEYQKELAQLNDDNAVG